MKNFENKEQGFIKTIVIIVVALIILGYLGIDIKQVIDSPTTQHNFSYVTQVILYVWNHFLKDITFYVWEHLILPVVHTVTESKKS